MSRKRTSVIWLGLFVVLAMVAIGAVVPNSALRAWRGFLPSSGGQDGGDPFARDGVGDGEMLVAGHENISSFANIEDAPFRSSDEPSLYDVFNDMYDEPLQPNKKQDRSIPLPPSVGSILEQRLADSKRGAREFSTLREQKRTSQAKQINLDSPALAYVSGRTPLHLRLETYDIYDGVVWYAEEMEKSTLLPPLKLAHVEDQPWMMLTESPSALNFTAKPEPHAIKVMRLDTNRIPAPVNLVGFHISLVDRPDFFHCAQPSILAMQRERLPESITVRTTSLVVDEDSIHPSRQYLGWSLETHRAIPESPRKTEIADLAKTWTKDLPDGWPSVCAIVGKLREHYTHDRTARPSPDCRFTADEFLFKTRRGDDYQFATSASVLLRSLGYSTRLVSGFYASPDRYELTSGLTPVLPEDAHVWLEVYLGSGMWHTVDPTPGYDVLQPRPGLFERLWSGCLAVCDWLTRRLMNLAVLTLLFAICFRFRFDLLDSICRVWLRFRWFRDPQRLIFGTGRLMDSRLRWCGCARPAGVTPEEWARRLQLHGLVDGDALKQFFSLWTRTVFASGSNDLDIEIVRQLCRSVLQTFSLPRLHRHFRRERQAIPARIGRFVRQLRSDATSSFESSQQGVSA